MRKHIKNQKYKRCNRYFVWKLWGTIDIQLIDKLIKDAWTSLKSLRWPGCPWRLFPVCTTTSAAKNVQANMKNKSCTGQSSPTTWTTKPWWPLDGKMPFLTRMQGTPGSVVTHLAMLALFAPAALSTLLAKCTNLGFALGPWHYPCEPVPQKALGVLVCFVVSNQPR